MKQIIHGVVFDLDGTLIDTVQDIAVSMNKTLAQYGYPQHPISMYRNWVGAGTANMVKCAANGLNSHSILLKEFIANYTEGIAVHSTPYPGVHSLLKQLNLANIPVAILTNKNQDMARSLVKTVLEDINFVTVQGLIEGRPAKPDPTSFTEVVQAMEIEPKHCLIVGDTEIDISTGINAGSRTMAVTWGYQEIEKLKNLSPDFVVKTPVEIIEQLHFTNNLRN